MSRLRILSSIAVALLGLVLLGACGADSSAEQEVGQAVLNDASDSSTDASDSSVNLDDENVATTVETDEDDSSAVSDAAEMPDVWPAALGVPATADPSETEFSVKESDGVTTIRGHFLHSTDDPYVDNLQAYYESQGWTVVLESEQDDTRTLVLSQSDGFSVNVNSTYLEVRASNLTQIVITTYDFE